MTDNGITDKLTRDIHVTDSQIFRQCRLKWRLGSKSQLNYEPKKPTVALWLGTGIHIALEAYYEGKLRGVIVEPDEVFEDWADQWIKKIREDVPFLDGEQDQQLLDARELGLGMLRHYIEWAAFEDDFDVIMVEHNFEILIAETDEHRWMYNGRLDLVIQNRQGFWVVDHKTTATLTGTDTQKLLLDEQLGSYIFAAGLTLGKPIQGAMYNFLRKKLPTLPKELINGGLSKAKNIDTTEEVYRAAIKVARENPNDYIDILQILADKGNTFFHREYVTRNVKEIVHMMERLVDIDRDMMLAEEFKRFYPTPDFIRCGMCPFIGVCVLYAEDGDVEFLLRNSFRKREKKEDLLWLDVVE